MRTGTILVVDDDQSARKALKRELSPNFSVVLLAENADAAEMQMSRHRIDVAIIDEKMPGRSGFELLDFVRDKYPSIQCIMLTGQAPHYKIRAALKDGRICAFLRKPWNRAVLLDHLEKVMDTSLAQNAVDALNINKNGKE
ncbi:MAG: response regulator [Candidatus Abyssubacteria bacterium]|nr:response regulator [Candidatus Abyssubacteria bacterium]